MVAPPEGASGRRAVEWVHGGVADRPNRTESLCLSWTPATRPPSLSLPRPAFALKVGGKGCTEQGRGELLHPAAEEELSGRLRLAPHLSLPKASCFGASKLENKGVFPEGGRRGRARARIWGKPGPRARTSPEAPLTPCIPPPLPRRAVLAVSSGQHTPVLGAANQGRAGPRGSDPGGGGQSAG